MSDQKAVAAVAGVDLSTIAGDVDKAVELVQGLVEFADKYGGSFVPQPYLGMLEGLDTLLGALDAVLKKV